MPPTARRTPGPYCYFFSYARENARGDVYFDDFEKDLRKSIADETGVPVADACFIDVNDIGLGEDWLNELARGLRTSRSFVYLLSPAYLLSPYCTKEWLAFKARMHAAGDASGAQARMFPVLWVARKRVEHLLPEPLKYLNDTSRGYPAEYGNQGVKWLRRMRGANAASDYDAFIRALTERIADIESQPPLPLTVPDLQSVPSDWNALDEAGAAAGPAAPGVAPGTPNGAAFPPAGPDAHPGRAADGAPLPLAAAPPARPAAASPPDVGDAAGAPPPPPVEATAAAAAHVVTPRAALFAYLAPQGPMQWRPFAEEPRAVALLAYELASREGMEYLPVDPREALQVVAERAGERNHPLVVLVDGSRLAEHEGALAALVLAATGGLLRGLVVLALWPAELRGAPGAGASEASWARLAAASGGWAEATLDVVANAAELSFKLPTLLTTTCLRLANADAGARSVPAEQPFSKPVLVGPGGAAQ